MRDDPLFGTQLQNQSELRVPNAEKAAFYLDAAVNSRSSKDDGRDSHFLYTLHVYQYSVAGKGGGEILFYNIIDKHFNILTFSRFFFSKLGAFRMNLNTNPLAEKFMSWEKLRETAVFEKPAINLKKLETASRKQYLVYNFLFVNNFFIRKEHKKMYLFNMLCLFLLKVNYLYQDGELFDVGRRISLTVKSKQTKILIQ